MGGTDQMSFYMDMKKKGKKRRKFKCNLCGHKMLLYNFPTKPCWCEVEFPSKYMYFHVQIKDFFTYCYQKTLLLFKDRWSEI